MKVMSKEYALNVKMFFCVVLIILHKLVFHIKTLERFSF